MESNELSKRMENHSLEPVRKRERKNGLSLTWNTTGIVTTLVCGPEK